MNSNDGSLPRAKSPTFGWLTTTLVALLVYALLAAIFMPTFPSSGRSITAECLSNVKQVAIGELIYASDNQESFSSSSYWMDATRPYTKVGERVYRCPELPKGQFGYAMSDALTGANSAELSDADKQVLIFESKSTRWNAHGSVISDLTEPRHKNSLCFGFADGHVRAGTTLEEALKMEWQPRRRVAKPKREKPLESLSDPLERLQGER